MSANKVDEVSTKVSEAVSIKYTNPRAEAMERVVTGAIEDREANMQGDEQYVFGYELPEIIEAEPSAAIEDLPSSELPQDSANVDNATILADTAVIEREGTQFLQLTVNGERSELSVPEAVTKLQMGINAEQQSRDAVQAKKLYEGKLSELQNAPPAKQDPPTRAADARPVIDAEELRRTVGGALQTMYDDGKVSDATEVFVDLLGKLQQPITKPVQAELTKQQIQTIAAEQTVETSNRIKDHDNLSRAFADFGADARFAEIVKDPTLKNKLDELTGLLQDDPMFMATRPSYAEIFNIAGERTLKWINSITAQKAGDLATEDPTKIEDIVAHKRKQPVAVLSRSARRGSPPEPTIRTNSDYIADMKKARGQT